MASNLLLLQQGTFSQLLISAIKALLTKNVSAVLQNCHRARRYKSLA
jgi:hypothetical protein